MMLSDVPTPTVARDEILVKIKATAVNHLDLVKASGAARQIFPLDLPWIPGHEFSGVIEQIGSDVAGYARGDAVFAANETGGAYAEYLAVKPVASQGNHPTSQLRRQHPCRWPPRLRGRDSSPTVTWKRDKRS